MKTSDFFYDLPQELIAQHPLEKRDSSKLLVYDRKTKELSDRFFYNIQCYIHPGDVLVINNTRVLPARLYGVNSETGGKLELLLLKRKSLTRWECLARPAKRAKIGKVYKISDELSARIAETAEEGAVTVEFIYNGTFEAILDKVGQMPLPPYITEKLEQTERYQTVYARENGSVAAPTAGLHFTENLLGSLREKGVEVVEILLHVGLGTFRPVSSENIEEHTMHSEYYEVSAEAAKRINHVRQNGGRIIAVGTTSCRTLESVADENGVIHEKSGWTDIFITPGYRFKAIDALITNFHLPESTLLMLVSALCSPEEILKVYQHAIREKYRFFSFGDAMLIQ